MRRRVITRVTTSFRSCLAAKTSSGTASSIPFRYNRRSCHCLPVSVKSDIHTSLIAFKPVQQCLSEAIFHLCLHIPLSLGTFRSQTAYSLCLLQEKVLRGFPCSVVYTCTLFFHEFSIWENRITFRKICKRGISRCNSRFLQTVTTSSAACTSTARPFETQWSLTSYPPPYWPQKVLYKSHPSGNLPSLSSASSS